MMRPAYAFALATTLAGCGLTTLFEPELPPLSTELQVIAATDVWSIPTDARFPTDVASLADGGFGILDGYQHRAKVFDSQRAFLADIALPDGYGDPVRGARAAEGDSWWFTVPASDGVMRVAQNGTVLTSFPITGAAGEVLTGPVAIHDAGTHLVVGLHDGSIVFADRVTGVVSATFRTDPDGEALGAITDIASDGEGRLWVADAFGSRVVLLDADGTALDFFGKFGLWAGWLAKPKAVAPGPDGTVLVADSLLRAVELFDPDGTFLGVVAQSDGTPLPLEHPIALEALPDGSYLVLDTKTAVVWGFAIDPATLAPAREAAASMRFLRTPLADLQEESQLATGVLCFQCHDGTIEDARFVWDPEMGHHPVGVAPLEAVPEFFPLVDGKLACTTCHSPHGTVSEETAATATASEVVTLVRHDPQTEDDLFTRVSRTDAALCVSCHTDAAHTAVLEGKGLEGTGHPTGKALADALAKRGGEAGPAGLPAGVSGSCLTCHAVHGADADGLRREGDDALMCLGCHEEKGDGKRNHPIRKQVAREEAVQRAGLTLTEIGENTCRTCHDLVSTNDALLARSDTGGTLCGTCHQATRLAGSHVGVRGDAGVPCLGCHAVHDGPADHHLLATLDHASGADPMGCLGCHGEGGVAHSGAKPGVVGHPVAGETTCASCHADPHKPDDVAACSTCHEDQHAAVERGGHGSATCIDCHSPHRASPSLSAKAIPPGVELNPIEQRCLGCHAKGTAFSGPKVAAFGHPAPVFTPGGARWTPLAALPLFDEKGNQLPPEQNGDLTCASCHEVHGPDATKPGDNLRRPGWEEVCGACHAEQALVMYRYFHDTDARRRMLGVTP